ncbi:metallophosphoesterase [Candidatus Micrarchaeota archaeon]|nr:metallophosphoesterase [Candidatus Micrarchaeota archaeon]
MEKEIKFLYDKPALIIDEDILVIADIHISAEKKLIPQGEEIINLTQIMLDDILEIISIHKIKKIYLLGDVKEDLYELTPELFLFFTKLSEVITVAVIKGNHDANLESIPKIKIHPCKGIVHVCKNKIKIGLAHGHAWPDGELLSCDYLILAHEHAHISIEDEKGKIYYEKVFLTANIDEQKAKQKYTKINKNCKLIIVPTFNPVLSGRAINEQKIGFGPIFRNKVFKMNSILIYTLKGICLGQLEEWSDRYGAKRKRKRKT